MRKPSPNNPEDNHSMVNHSEAAKSRISTSRIYSGKIFSVDLDQVRYPDETVGEVEIVRHPGGCAILPFLSDPEGYDPQILLIRQFRYATGGSIYEIPAGRLTPGEDPKAAAIRELKEETGCTAARMEHLFSSFTAPGFTDEIIHTYIATELTNGATELEPHEFVEVVPVKLSRALTMIQQGEIRDSKTSLAILYAAGFSAGL